MLIDRRNFLIASAGFIASHRLGMFTTASAHPEARIFLAQDFGITPNGNDAAPGLQRVCAALSAAGGGHLIFAPGDYVILATSGVAVSLSQLKNVTIDGNGAFFKFRGLCRPFYFRECSNVCIQNLTIDWVRPPFSQGDVVNLANGGKSIEVLLDAITPLDGWDRVQAIGGYERDSGLLSRTRIDAYGVVSSIKPLDQHRVVLNCQHPLEISPGQTLALRHYVYDAHALSFHKCQNIVINNVTVHTAPGMAFVMGLCKNVSITNCKVVPKPSSGRFMSTTADAVHLSDCCGQLTIVGCVFASMGDDGVNVHKTYWKIVELSDRKTLVATKRGNAQFDIDETPQPEDTFYFVSRATLEQSSAEKLSSATLLTPIQEKLTFSNVIPGNISVGDYIIRANSDSLRIKQCQFTANRARGVLAHNNAVISQCEFRDQSMQAIVLSPDLYWQEGPAVTNVTIAENIIDGVNRWGNGQAAILIDALITDSNGNLKTSPGHPNHDININRNIFRNVDGPEIIMHGVH